MTKKKSDLLRTSENRRVSSYGEYYISVKKIEILGNERGDCESFYPYSQLSLGYPMLIRAVFESDKEYFDKTSKGRWLHNIPLSTNAYTISRSIYHFDISLYLPSLTTLNIIKERGFIRLLLRDKEIYDALTYFLNSLSTSYLPPTPPMSAFESFLKRQIIDIETRLKLQIDYPIAFEDIEEAGNTEVREQALRKFGYENYVKEGFEKGKIREITFNRDYIQRANNTYYYIGTQIAKNPIPKKFNPKYNKDEKIILLTNDICFLQVKDSSTNKAYFLKVPPDMRSVEEAKAWTFGLKKEEYKPMIET